MTLNKLAQLNSDSIRFCEDRDCSVKAMALVAGISYEKAHGIMRDCGRKRRNGTPTSMTIRALGTLNLACVPRTRLPKTVNQCDQQLSKSGKYLICVRGHILAFVDGKVQDWTAGRRHKVLRIYKVRRMSKTERADRDCTNRMRETFRAFLQEN